MVSGRTNRRAFSTPTPPVKAPLDQLTVWLNDAYSMEKSVLRMLEQHATAAKDIVEIHSRFQQHVAESREHSVRLEECLDLLGQKPSTAKAVLGTIMGMVEGVSTGLFHDQLVKNLLMDYGAEHFEIASYRSLVAAAEELGQPRIAELCRANLRDEEAMAQWLEEEIPPVTRMALQQPAVA
jgi:ferritin-like metal-binding protein YciE